jgi:hypothetical protein
VGIVFAPTLNIPAWLISLFLTDYTPIFGLAIDEEKAGIKDAGAPPHSHPESLRTPKQQQQPTLPDVSAPPPYTQQPQSHHSMQPSPSGNAFAPLSGGGRAHRSTFMQPPTATGSQPDLHRPYGGPPSAGYQQQQHQSYHPAMGQMYGPPASLVAAPQQQAMQQQMQMQQQQQLQQQQQMQQMQMQQHQQQAQYQQQQHQLYQQQHPVQPMANHPYNLSAPDSRRNRRESAMMGMDIGLIGQQRHPGRMTPTVGSGPSTPQPAYS